MADIALHPTFPDQEVERQRASRIGQLVQQKQNAAAMVGTIMASVLYGERHPYGTNELGTDASLKATTRADMQRFWKETFVPNNAALVVTGDITLAALRPTAEKLFGGWQPSGGQSVPPPVPESVSPKIVIVDRPGSPQTQLRVAGIGAPRSVPEFAAIQVMNTAFGGVFSSRINMNLREEHGYTYGGYSQFSFRRAAGPFAIGAGVRTDATAPAVVEIFKEVDRIHEHPVEGEELQLAKDSLTRSLPAAFETSPNVAGSFSNIYIYDLGLDYFTHYTDRIGAVTAADVKAAADKYVQRNKLLVVAVGDRQKIQPELEKLNVGPIEVRTGDEADRSGGR
jgi:zinc protease